MKKIFTIVILSVMALGSVEAHKLISFGPKVGMNLNYASGSEMLKAGNIGYSFGVFLEVRPVKFISVSADVLYSKEGFKADMEYQGVGTSFNYNLGYLNIPILANIYVWKGLNIKAGIQPQIKLDGKVSLSGVESENVGSQFEDNIKKGAFSIPVGIGYSFGIGLVVDLRYNINLTQNATMPIVDQEFSSKVVTLTVGWRF